MPEFKSPSTILELLKEKASVENPKGILYGDSNIYTSYKDLLERAEVIAKRLEPLKNDIVILALDNHKDNIEFFWGCVVAGIKSCPVARLHPDEEARKRVLKHIYQLFEDPVIVGTEDAVSLASIVPEFRAVTAQSLMKGTATIPKVAMERKVKGDCRLLNLSSGSTGVPKGIRIMDEQILSSVNGKQKSLESNANSKFLGYINFDHVASSMEIHMHALYAGADQVQLPAEEVIGNPISFLENIEKHKITHAFTPNFLFAGIIDHPTVTTPEHLDLSSLRHIVSGGEAIPAKAALILCKYMASCGAKEEVISSAFGMTETCGGSIYSVMPFTASEGVNSAFLPVGKCAPGLEMRIVVDADEKGMGKVSDEQVGELQIRGTSVFPGYYNNPEGTAAAFTPDGWFRSGDVGNLDRKGSLYLAGRSKDSIIVNGVKISSSEIESLLEEAKIPGMTPTFTIVAAIRLKDAATETFSVFYLPEFDVNAETDKIISINHRVNEICQRFVDMRPHSILPLGGKAMSKTSLGKLSRSRLGQMYQQGEFDAEYKHVKGVLNNKAKIAPRTKTEKVMVEGVSELFDVKEEEVSVEDSLFDLGGTSMHLVRYRNLVAKKLAMKAGDIPVIVLMRNPVIADLAAEIDQIAVKSSTGETGNAAYDPVVPLQTTGEKTPLFLVHPGVGEVLVFVNLARYFTGERPVYGIRARGFGDGETPFETFEDMVAGYVASIKKRQAQGPYAIAGYSYGGAVAFEIAKVLEKEGQEVRFTGIFNLPPYMRFRLEQLNWSELAANLAMFLALIPQEEIQGVEDELKADPSLTKEQQVQIILQYADKQRCEELDVTPEYLLRWIDLAMAVNGLGRTYNPSGKQKNLHVFYAHPILAMGSKEEYLANHLKKWDEFADGKIRYIEADGAHYTMLNEVNARTFQTKIRNILKNLDL